ncbi:MAG: hypothetical protein ACTSWF_13825, partial [Candidatus Freyarchaeota archaeon]
GISTLSMFVLLSIFVLALSLILLFFFNVALPAYESDNPFILGNFEVHVESLEPFSSKTLRTRWKRLNVSTRGGASTTLIRMVHSTRENSKKPWRQRQKELNG